MLFISDEVRDEFHKTNSLLQMISQVLESFCFRYASQVEVLQVVNKSQALLKAKGLENIQMESIEDLMNRQYGRKDQHPTCKIISLKDNTFMIYARLSSDLANLN